MSKLGIVVALGGLGLAGWAAWCYSKEKQDIRGVFVDQYPDYNSKFAAKYWSRQAELAQERQRLRQGV